MVSSWPVFRDELHDPESENKMNTVMEAIRSIRNIRAEMKVPVARKARAVFVINDENMGTIFAQEQSTFMRLAGVSGFDVFKNRNNIPEDAVSSVIRGVEIYIPMEELLDFEKEMERLQKEKENLDAELSRVNGKLQNESFTAKAPAAVVEAEKEKQKKYRELYDKVVERMNFIREKL